MASLTSGGPVPQPEQPGSAPAASRGPTLARGSPAPRARRTLLSVAAIALWFVAVMMGMIALSRYKSTPGPQGSFPSRWPDGTELQLTQGRHTLLVFLHPRCPCSRATVSELARLVTEAGAALRIQVIFHVPEGTDDGFAQTELWRRVQELPGVTAVLDRGGETARQFGAATSGQALLYAPDGALRFAGGITIARGHEGRSPGTDRILALLHDPSATRASAPVFGCALSSRLPAK